MSRNACRSIAMGHGTCHTCDRPNYSSSHITSHGRVLQYFLEEQGEASMTDKVEIALSLKNDASDGMVVFVWL